MTEGEEIWKRASIAPLNSLGVLAVPGRTRICQGAFQYLPPVMAGVLFLREARQIEICQHLCWLLGSSAWIWEVNRRKWRYHTVSNRNRERLMRKFLAWLQKRIKHWIKPTHPGLISRLLSDLTRSRTDLVVENALLRQQLIIL